jgi:predicted O-methyltransferase YrrM
MKQPPLISTVVLNWNRADLLFRTLESYRNTISVPHEIFIIDNASSDNSHSIIEDFCAKAPRAEAIFLPQNMGGEAINIGLEKAQGRYLHISENDLEYLPHWSTQCIELFEKFQLLGQLSFFGPLPDDDTPGGVGAIPPSKLRHLQGSIIYETENNVVTTCMIRRAIWDLGIRVHSLPEHDGVIFPDDGRLSQEIKQAGFLVAHTDHGMVRNIGHTVAELKARQDYYLRNYRAKPWLGEAGLKQRLDKWENSHKPQQRTSFLLPEENIVREKSHPSQACTAPYLWSMLDEWTPELETLEFLYTFTRLIKPLFCLETGAWRGFTTYAIGRALYQNGRGHLMSLEQAEDIQVIAHERIVAQQLTEKVKVIHAHSLLFQVQEKIDLLVLDADLNTRLAEFEHFETALSPAAFVVVHDAHHPQVYAGLQAIVAVGRLKMLYLPTPRGIALCQRV